jgi:hypothetical protein
MCIKPNTAQRHFVAAKEQQQSIDGRENGDNRNESRETPNSPEKMKDGEESFLHGLIQFAQVKLDGIF